jgi:CHAT domain-containing protein
VAALLNAQRNFARIQRTNADTLLVVVQNPFQGSTLPMAPEEANVVRSLITSKTIETSSCANVLANVQSTSILHMVCHGSQDRSDALQSSFSLEDGILTVSELIKLELPNAFLAVLSACETAKGDASQPDQAIHLAAAMLFAGFKSVVATMWYGLPSLLFKL